ncbi:hypothetical protein NE237_001223 [Protea cynaroides]|uniref:MADS-box domain-containing protein n=1 Tax=Protea cynaroides TaxID=273540 RepID=A0A9Q0KSP9_9MAGN|nr:hypothetical protein NE237_001223 [Protea cynaroides]
MSTGRKKVTIEKLKSPVARLETFSRRKKGLIKKANELSILCNSDVGLIMFSPSGNLTSFASHGSSLEDVFIRFLRHSPRRKGIVIENKEQLVDSLMHLKYEAQIVELLAEKEALETEFKELTQRLTVVQDIMRCHNPDPNNVASIHQAEVTKKYITDALQHVRQTKENLLGNHIPPQEAEAIEIPEGEIADAGQMIEELLESDFILLGDQPRDGHLLETGSSSTGPDLGISSISERNNWNLPGSSLPFEEILDDELFNALPDEQQQNMDES